MARRFGVALDRLPRCLRVRKVKLPRGLDGNPLAFTMQYQAQSQWCWSATAVSVNLYYDPGSGWTQCKCANAALGQTICCQNGSACNGPYYLSKALQTVGNFKTRTDGKASLATVKAEIDQSHPLCLRIEWNGGGGSAHFVAVYGYSGGSIYIGDPWNGYSEATYGLFPGSYFGGGVWTDSYFTAP